MNALRFPYLYGKVVVIATSCFCDYVNQTYYRRCDEARQLLAYQVTVLADQIARRTSSVVKRYELNLSQWRVLAAVADKPGRTSAEVVTITPMDKGIVSRATKALLTMGLLTRVASQSDGGSAICT